MTATSGASTRSFYLMLLLQLLILLPLVMGRIHSSSSSSHHDSPHAAASSTTHHDETNTGRRSLSTSLNLDDFKDVYVPNDDDSSKKFDIQDGLNENFLLLSRLAGELSMAVNEEDSSKTNSYFPDTSTQSWVNEPDKAMIVQIHDICYVAFRATTWTIDDWSQNLNPKYSRRVCNTDGQCCTTRQGFYEAYHDVNYLDSLETALEECVKTCCVDPNDCDSKEEEWCDVVLTGTRDWSTYNLNYVLLTFIYLNCVFQIYVLLGRSGTMVVELLEPLDEF